MRGVEQRDSVRPVELGDWKEVLEKDVPEIFFKALKSR
jgi:hypothetical protein